jgi:sortase A
LRRSEVSLVARLLLAAGALTACADGPAPEPAVVEDVTLPPAGTPALPTPRSAAIAPEPAFEVSDGKPLRAEMTIPRIGVQGLVVVPYRGFTDDAPGTVIQNRGRAASPHGPRGGTGPGGIGNFQVTAHRTSSTRAFELLPDLRVGDRVRVVAGGVEYVYEVVGTRRTSFRSPASLRAQRAAVPGHPGREPTRAMITLSTCATPEDHAAGNYWADRFGNPEHRIDKIGRLVRTRPARS